MLPILEAACETDSPASLMAAHMTFSCAGRLQSAADDGVVVEVTNASADSIRAGAACAVSFPSAGRSVGFTSRVLRVDEREVGVLSVTLELPTKLRHNEKRVSVRVPVAEGGLAAAILRGESRHIVRVIDISLRGILIAFNDDAPDLDPGHRRMIALKRGDRSVLLEAEVRRRDGSRYGMAFVLREKPPRDLVRIIQELQQAWSRSRTK